MQQLTVHFYKDYDQWAIGRALLAKTSKYNARVHLKTYKTGRF